MRIACYCSPLRSGSITRGFNGCWFPYVDCPSASWSTGTSSYSHYRRIRDYFHPSVSGQAKLASVTWAQVAS